MTRVIHTGDTHLGYRQYHEAERRQDFMAAFESVLEDAVADDVDAVIHAGDLFHDRRPALPDVMGAVEALRTLRRADIPFFAVVGNHEGTRSAQWVDLFERLGLAERLGTEGRVVGDTTFYGLDYTPASKRDQLDYAFSPPDTEYSALVSHGAFEPFAYGDWELAAVLEQSPVDFDIVLLGDNHQPERETVLDTPAVYSGSTERTSAEERDPRGYNLVRFKDGVSVRRRGLDTRDFVFVDVTLEPGEGGERVRERLREEDLEGAVVIVTIEGDGERVVPADIEAVGSEQGALVTRVNDRRDIDTETEMQVSFIDPDAAVEDRLADLGMSQLALDIDDLVRDADIADTALRARVKDRVESMEEQSDVFEKAPPDKAEATGAERDCEESEGERPPTVPDSESDSASEEAEATDGETAVAETADTDEEASAEPDPDEEGQVTMEDYL
jgi:exonuclease SbcD